jgi:hypothetical protein
MNPTTFQILHFFGEIKYDEVYITFHERSRSMMNHDPVAGGNPAPPVEMLHYMSTTIR